MRIERKGRGYALKQIWGASRSDIVSYMDVDLSTGLEAFPELIRRSPRRATTWRSARGWRRSRQITRSLKRRVLTRGYNTMIKAMFWTRFSDAQCGFKAVSRERVRSASCR